MPYRDLEKKEATLCAYRERNRARINAYAKTWRLAHPERVQKQFDKLKGWRADWDAKNRQKRAAQQKARVDANRSAHRQYASEWRQKNRDKLKVYNRTYREKHLELLKEKDKKAALRKLNRAKERMMSDPIFALRRRIRARIASCLRTARNNPKKAGKTIALLGCSYLQLRTHLEERFLPGMTWENHGFFGWHIDHIKPCASFDLSDPEQQRVCFHYTNLQPLWASDNLRKNRQVDWIPSSFTQAHSERVANPHGLYQSDD